MVEDKRFWSKVVKVGDCLEYQNGFCDTGYCKVQRGEKTWLAHRYSYTISKGEIPEGMFILHSCDNRRCVNPEHLSVGTHAQNMADAVARGTKSGMKNGNCKLKDDDVDFIVMCREWGVSRPRLADEFGVSWTTIDRIWRHNGRESS